MNHTILCERLRCVVDVLVQGGSPEEPILSCFPSRGSRPAVCLCGVCCPVNAPDASLKPNIFVSLPPGPLLLAPPPRQASGAKQLSASVERTRQSLRRLRHPPHSAQTGSCAHGPDAGPVGPVSHLVSDCPEWPVWNSRSPRPNSGVCTRVASTSSTVLLFIVFVVCSRRAACSSCGLSVTFPEPQPDSDTQPEPRTPQQQPLEPRRTKRQPKLTNSKPRAQTGVQTQLPGTGRRGRSKERGSQYRKSWASTATSDCNQQPFQQRERYHWSAAAGPSEPEPIKRRRNAVSLPGQNNKHTLALSK